MLRLVYIEGVLKLLDRTASAPLVLKVEDDVIGENAGSYTIRDGEVVSGTEAGE